MSRSGYTDDCEDLWAMIRWRGAVKSAIRGARGQAMLRELIAALDALPEKRLAADSLVTDDGEFCALGALGHARGLDMSEIDPYDREAVAKAFGIAEALAAEIMYKNDECAVANWVPQRVEICGPMRRVDARFVTHWEDNEHAAEQRWRAMRAWVERHLKEKSHG